MKTWAWLNDKFATLRQEYGWYNVECQLCGESHDNSDDFASCAEIWETRQEAIKGLKLMGWRRALINGAVYDCCPECWVKLPEEVKRNTDWNLIERQLYEPEQLRFIAMDGLA